MFITAIRCLPVPSMGLLSQLVLCLWSLLQTHSTLTMAPSCFTMMFSSSTHPPQPPTLHTEKSCSRAGRNTITFWVSILAYWLLACNKTKLIILFLYLKVLFQYVSNYILICLAYFLCGPKEFCLWPKSFKAQHIRPLSWLLSISIIYLARIGVRNGFTGFRREVSRRKVRIFPWRLTLGQRLHVFVRNSFTFKTHLKY